jgi:riboflavin transporter FmnP
VVRYRRMAAVALVGIPSIVFLTWMLALIRPPGLTLDLFVIPLVGVLALGGVAFYLNSIAEDKGEFHSETAQEMVEDLKHA